MPKIRKIRKILLNLEGFQCATSLDLNMGYYHIYLIKQASKICNIILSWGKYRYKRLTIGDSNYPDIFQEKMNEMFRGFGFIWAYIDDLLIITKCDWSNHLDKLKLTLQNRKYNWLKCNIKTLSFGKTEMEYLGFWVTRTGIRLINKKL